MKLNDEERAMVLEGLRLYVSKTATRIGSLARGAQFYRNRGDTKAATDLEACLTEKRARRAAIEELAARLRG